MKESRKARSSVLKRLFYDYLASQGLKRTQQRDLILDTFLSSEHHVNVDDLIRRVRESDPQTGYATVYRTVNLFLESGIAQEVRLSDSCDWPFEIPQFLANNFPQFAELRMASQPVFRKTSGG